MLNCSHTANEVMEVDYTSTRYLLNQYMANHCMMGEEVLERKTFAGYEVIIRGGAEFSMASIHQVQQIALLLNDYESLK